MGCEYCKDVSPKPIMNGEVRVEVYGDDAQIWVEWYGRDDSKADHETINYCPMCGRELKRDA